MRASLAALALAAGALWILYLQLAFVGYQGDAIYYLEPARHFARGQGVVTNILYPAQVAAVRGEIRFPAPFLWHGPLAPIAIGWCYRLFRFAEWAPLVYSFGLLLITGLLCYSFARNLAGEKAGLVAAALLWTNAPLLDSCLGALTDPLFTFFVAAAAGLLWRSQKGDVYKWCALAGIALGLASSARLAGQVYWIGFLAAARCLHGSWRPAAALLGGLAVSLVPLLGYNWRYGSTLWLSPGFYVLLYSRDFPGAAAATSYLPLSAARAALAYPGSVLLKAVTGPLYGVNGFLERAQAPFVAVALLLGMTTRAQSSQAERWRKMALWIAAPVFVANLLLATGDVRYLQPLLPLALPLAAAFALRFIADQWPGLARKPVLATTIFAGLVLSPLALQLKDFARTRLQRRQKVADIAALGAFIQEHTKPGDVLFADHPPGATWGSQRAAIHLGYTVEDSERILRRVKPAALVLSNMHLHSSDYDETFRRAYRQGTAVLGFSPCERFASSTVDAVLFRPQGSCMARR